MAEERYSVKYPLPDDITDYVAGLRGRERSGQIESAQTNAYLAELLDAGWTLRAIANAFNGVNIEAVRERINRSRERQVERIPDAPAAVESPSVRNRADNARAAANRGSRTKYVIPDHVARRMRDLQVDAREVRGSTPEDSPKRVASKDLTILMKEQRDLGATLMEIGEACGVSWNAVKFRLGRYGMYDLPPSVAHTLVEDLSGMENTARPSSSTPSPAPVK